MTTQTNKQSTLETVELLARQNEELTDEVKRLALEIEQLKQAQKQRMFACVG